MTLNFFSYVNMIYYILSFLNYRLVRRSLGDEIKRLGITGSPFCDKRKSLSPNRNVDLNTSLQNSFQENQISDEITPTKKIPLETINENIVLGFQAEEKKLETYSIQAKNRPFDRIVMVFLQFLSIISIGQSQAKDYFRTFFQKVRFISLRTEIPNQ